MDFLLLLKQVQQEEISEPEYKGFNSNLVAQINYIKVSKPSIIKLGHIKKIITPLEIIIQSTIQLMVISLFGSKCK